MIASEIRQNARKTLTGKWGKAALTMLVYSTIVSLLQLALGIGSIVISYPLSYGIIVTFMKLKRGDETTILEFFEDGFNSFVKVWKTVLWTWFKIIIPIILVIISYLLIFVGLIFGGLYYFFYGSYSTSAILMIIGFIALIPSSIYAIIKYLLYSLNYFILYDNPDMKAKEVVEESARLMKGNRWSYVYLLLTFIGWAILSILTLGIGYLWLLPYIYISQIIFYETLSGKIDTSTVAETITAEKSEKASKLDNIDNSSNSANSDNLNTSNHSDNSDNSNNSDNSGESEGPIKENT